MVGQTYDLLAASLQELRRRFGDDLFIDRRRLNSLLYDKAPEAKREIRALASAVEEGVPHALLSAERQHLGLEMDRQAARLESSTGLRKDIALPVVRVIAFSLDLGPLPSAYQQATPAPRAAPDTGDGAWAGLSQPTGVASTGHHQPPAGPGGRPAPAGGPFDKLPFDKKYLAFGAAGLVALVLGYQVLGPKPGVGPGSDTPASPQQETVPPAATGPGYADENVDFGVPPKRELESNVGSRTPISIPVGRRVTTDQVRQMIAQDRNTLLIDVLADPHPSTIQGAVFIPAAGMGGTVTDATQGQVVTQLRQAVGENTDRPLIFFCAGATCWESYNAVLRAHAAGYRNIFWYRGGLASWTAAGLPMQPLQQQPQQALPSSNLFMP